MRRIKDNIPLGIRKQLKICFHILRWAISKSKITDIYLLLYDKYNNRKFYNIRSGAAIQLQVEQKNADKLLYATDWLASEPYFYNEQTGKHSNNINEVIDFSTLTIDRSGLQTYFTAGYCIDGATMIKGVRFMRPHSSLYQRDDGSVYERENPDPVLEKDWRLKPAQIFELLESKIHKWENSHPDPIYIPTSGGYDSRLLNFFVKDKSRIRSATYGISGKQDDSYEVTIAKQLSQRLNTRWRHFPLGNYNRYIRQWYDLYGVSTHAHGMYHMEFHEQALAEWGHPLRLLSGLIGDVWAGLSLPRIYPSNISRLFYSHGVSLPVQTLRLTESDVLENYYARKKVYLAHDRLRIVEAMRNKIILLSYLTRVPASMGIPAYAPYIEPELALAMLFLPTHLRRNRVWQTEFFKKNHLDFSGQRLNYENVLDLEAHARLPYPEIKEYLKEFVSPELVDAFNYYGTKARCYRDAIAQKPAPSSLISALVKAGIIFDGESFSTYRRIMEFLCSVGELCLPIQTLLEDRDATNIH